MDTENRHSLSHLIYFSPTFCPTDPILSLSYQSQASARHGDDKAAHIAYVANRTRSHKREENEVILLSLVLIDRGDLNIKFKKERRRQEDKKEGRREGTGKRK